MRKPLPPNPFVKITPTVSQDQIRALWKGLDKQNLPNDIKRLIITKYSQGKTWKWHKSGPFHGPKHVPTYMVARYGL